MKYLILPLIWMIGLCTATMAQSDKEAINTLLDNWHQAAATADEDVFFGSMTEGAIYIGTDKTERWTREEMREWSKQYFDRDTAWAFTPIERQIHFDQKGKVAWFNETLETWMGVCRSSGVLEKVKKQGWKLSHYHLSVTIDNDLIQDFISLINGEKKEGTSESEDKPLSQAVKAAVKAPIIQLFEAMRQGDGQLLLDCFTEGATLHTTMQSKEGKPITKKDSISQFAETVGKPHDQVYDERILEYKIRVDGDLATVWTPYEFYFGEKFSHCGINAFQLVNTERGWKILHITDTRRKKNCK